MSLKPLSNYLCIFFDYLLHFRNMNEYYTLELRRCAVEKVKLKVVGACCSPPKCLPECVSVFGGSAGS